MKKIISYFSNKLPDERGSAVILSLGILGLAMSIGLAFLYSARQHNNLSGAQADIIKVRLLAESGLERALAGMERNWQPRNDDTWYNFTEQDIEDLEDKLSGEFYPEDIKDGSTVSVKLIYHGGKIDPNWFGNDGSLKNSGIGFSPIGHKIDIDGASSSKLYVERSEMVPSTPTLWYSREQIHCELDEKMNDVKFSKGDIENSVFFPFSARDSSSPSSEESDKDEPYLVVRRDGRCCNTSNPDSYEAIFHKNFCEKYGPKDSNGKRMCVYFGGCNTFIDRDLAKYEDGQLINPQVAIKRRIPFYCLRYIHGKEHGGGPISLRQPDQIRFCGPDHSRSSGLNYPYDNVPEYLRDQRLIDCVPWFRRIAATEEYGSNGSDTTGRYLARFWQLISNFCRYCGPSGVDNHQFAVCVYDSNVNGWPYCGRRAGAVFSKLRFRLVKHGDAQFQIEMQPETVNFHLQSEQEGNRTWARLQGHDFLSGHVLRVEVNGTMQNMALRSYPMERTSPGSINGGWPTVKIGNPINSNTVTIKSINMNTHASNTPTYSYWGSPIRLDFDDELVLTCDGDGASGDGWVTLECKDPLNNNFNDAWIISKSEWGRPNVSWDEAGGVYQEGKMANPNGGDLAYIPLTAYVRGTFPNDSLSGYSNVAENNSTYIRTLWEVGCINRAIPGRTIDLLDEDKELLDQFCIFPGDDYDSFKIAKGVYANNSNDRYLEDYLTESGKINPNGLTTEGVNIIARNLMRQSNNTTPNTAYGYPMNANSQFSSLSLPVENYGTRAEAAVALAKSFNGSIRDQEEIAGKMAQLMQIRYQYFEVMVTARVAKRIAGIDGGGIKQTGNAYLVAVVERDAFTGAVRVLTKRERFRELTDD